MTSKWVVGVDGSDGALDALRWAAQQARGRGVQIVAVGAYHVPASMALMTAKRGFGVDELGLAATAGHDVDEAINLVLDEVNRAGSDDRDTLTIESLIIDGHPAHELAEVANDADMLIVGRSGGGGGFRRHALGSVSRYCATHASAPVVVVPPEWEARPTTKIAVGFDGSAQSEIALRWAMEFAPANASVSALAAIEHAPWVGQDLTLARFPDEIGAEEQRIKGAIDDIDQARVVDRDIALRSPRRMLAEVSARADLVVLGTRGHGRITAGLLGSVSAWMLEESLCPVVVVPDVPD